MVASSLSVTVTVSVLDPTLRFESPAMVTSVLAASVAVATTSVDSTPLLTLRVETSRFSEPVVPVPASVPFTVKVERVVEDAAA